MKISYWFLAIALGSSMTFGCDDVASGDADAGTAKVVEAQAQPQPNPQPPPTLPPPAKQLQSVTTIDEQSLGDDALGTIRTVRDDLHGNCYAVLGVNVNRDGKFVPVGFKEISNSACRTK